MILPLTDDRGKILIPWYADPEEEPLPGSVVLRQGLHGTAFQRFFTDGPWHPVLPGRPAKTWAEMLCERNLVLVYDAEERAS